MQLTIDLHPSQFLNTTVEIFGEVRLYDATSDVLKLSSAHSLIQTLRNLKTTLQETKGAALYETKLKTVIEEFRRKYRVIVQVHTIRHVKQGREIIAENLHFRQIQNFRAHRIKKTRLTQL